jgi:AraC-like DNA-binding protein
MKTGKSKMGNRDFFKAEFDDPTAQDPSGNQAPSLKSVAEAEPSELFAFKECQDLFRKRLREPMLRLIPQLTGLRLHVLWHRPMDFQGSGERPVLCPRARQRAGANGRQPKCCQSCLQRRWKPALSPANQGRRFIGQCGATNFCACLQVDKVCPLTLVLQARVVSCSIRTCSRTMNPGVAASRQSAAIIREESQRRSAETPLRGYGSWKGEPVSPAAFHHAVDLARLILHDLESTAQARMAGSGLENAMRRLNNTETEATRLRGELRHRLPDLPKSTVQPGLGSHAQKLVDAMLDYVHQHGHRPISLDELASAMKRNASYLSTLFSQTTGVTFHQFLEEVRLSKARELLCDPRNRVHEVACAEGYASPDAFRHAFKAHEGLSPEAWRAGQ